MAPPHTFFFFLFLVLLKAEAGTPVWDEFTLLRISELEFLFRPDTVKGKLNGTHVLFHYKGVLMYVLL